MPNWCNTSYVMVGKEKEVKELFDIMSDVEAKKKADIKTDFGNTWLGYLAIALNGYDERLHCRGHFYGLVMSSEDHLVFSTETAWNPCDEVIDLIKKRFPSLKVYFYSEEPGEGIYATNDVEGLYFPERWYVDLTDENSECYSGYFVKLEDALKAISENTGREIKSREQVEWLSDLLSEKDGYCALEKIVVEPD